MTKEEYLTKAFGEIRAKQLQVPFEITSGTKVPDVEMYLNSLRKSYLSTKPPMDSLFYEKIEALRKYNQ